MSSRIPRLRPEDLTAEQRQLYQSINGGGRAHDAPRSRLTDDQGRLEGPFNAMLLNPPIGDALQRLGAAVRYRGRLPDRCRELAILAVAAHWRSGFEQRAHEPIAAAAGLTDAELTALRTGAPLELTDPREMAVLQTTRHLLRHPDLDEPAYRDASAVLGPDVLFELTTVVGYYSLLALQMRVFAVG
jgi:4-carboxymuconolactone decarboxylase